MKLIAQIYDMSMISFNNLTAMIVIAAGGMLTAFLAKTLVVAPIAMHYEFEPLTVGSLIAIPVLYFGNKYLKA
jgi:hypothetical protein